MTSAERKELAQLRSENRRLREDWWRIFRRQALTGQAFADPGEIAYATRVATAQLTARARPWIWGRPQPKPKPKPKPKPRSYRRRFVYTL